MSACAVLSSALVISACSGAGDDPAETTDVSSRMIITESAGPDTLDPIASSLYNVDSMVWSTVYDTLLTTSVEGELSSRLATDWEVSDDKLTYTFTLREDVTFHNGNPLTASDVVYSLERARAKGIPMVTARFDSVATIEAPDDATVVITLKAPNSAFLATIADPSGVGVSVLDEETTADPATEPVGTGPLKFVSYTPNSQLVLERNDDYWDEDALPAYKTLEVRFVEDDQSQVAALSAGEVSVIQPTATATLQQLRSNDSVEIASYPGHNFFITISRIGATAPPEVAKAIALAIDREALAATAYLGEAEPGSTAHPVLSYGLGPDELPNHERDVEKAQELLAAAGHPDGIDLGFIYPTRPPYTNSFFEVLQSSLEEAGIRVQLEPVEQQVWLSRFLKAEYDLSASDQGWYADPLRYVLPRAGWQAPVEEVAPELVGLLDAYRSATSEEEKGEAFQEIQMFEAENAYPFLGTVWATRGVAYRPDLVAEVAPETLVTGSRRAFYLALAPQA